MALLLDEEASKSPDFSQTDISDSPDNKSLSTTPETLRPSPSEIIEPPLPNIAIETTDDASLTTTEAEEKQQPSRVAGAVPSESLLTTTDNHTSLTPHINVENTPNQSTDAGEVTTTVETEEKKEEEILGLDEGDDPLADVEHLPLFIKVRTADEVIVDVPRTTAVQTNQLANIDGHAVNYFFEVVDSIFEVFLEASLYSDTPAMVYDYHGHVPKGVCFAIAEFAQEHVHLDKLRSPVLEKVIIFCEYHRLHPLADIAKPVRSVKMERIVNDVWFADYINQCSKKTMFQIIIAANYLGINSLLHLGCAKIATLIKGKSPDEIKAILADEE